VLLDKAYEAKNNPVLIGRQYRQAIPSNSTSQLLWEVPKGRQAIAATMEMGILLKAWKLGSVTARRHKRESGLSLLDILSQRILVN
jgi:hypothetical protein